MDTNKNSYTIIYAAVLVAVVAFLLAFASSALKPAQDKNVEIDKKKQILAALNVRNLSGAEEIEKKYDECVVADLIVDSAGNVVKSGEGKDKDGFSVSSKDVTPACMPLYLCRVNGETKLVLPMTGRGLWGGLWGYLAVNDDRQTVFGAYFSHESETAGLGALIAEEKFQDQFKGKHLFVNPQGSAVALTVVKNGKTDPAKKDVQVDGVTGATLTSVGVGNMVTSGAQAYAACLKAFKETQHNSK